MNRRTLGVGALALTAILVGDPRQGAAQQTSIWPTYHGGAQRNGISAISGPATLKRLNTWMIQGPTTSSPALGPDGTAYVADGTGLLYAFNPSHPSAPLWTFKAGDKIEGTASVSPDGTRVFFGADDGQLYALNTANGSKVWSADMGGTVYGSPAVTSDGSTLFVATIGGTIHSVNTSTGTDRWTANPGAPIRESLSLSGDGSTIFAGLTSSVVVGLPTSGPSGGGSGQAYTLDTGPVSSPSIDNNSNIYITTVSGAVLAFSPGTSTPKWTFRFPNFASSASTPAVTADRVYVGAANGNLYALDASSGNQVWQAHTNGAIGSSPVVTTGNGQIYVTSDDGLVYAFDSTGKQLASLSVGGFFSGSPAVGADGSIWVVSQTGNVLRLGSVSQPSGPPNTPTPGPSSTPVNTPTPGPTSTPTATPSPTAAPLSVSASSPVAPGSKETISVKGPANAKIRIRVEYPNGDHQSKSITTGADGSGTYSYTQAASKITHSHSTANVIVKTGSGAGQVTVNAKYTIGYGKIDVSAEPRTVKAGQVVNIYIHQKPGTAVIANVQLPNGRVNKLTGKPGKKGWAHIKYKVPKGTTASGHKATVVAKLAKGDQSISSKTTFTIS